MEKHIYRLVAYRDGREITLAEYRGPTEGLYGFKVTRVERRAS